MLRLLRRLRARIKYRHFERDLREELNTHRALTEDALEHGGLPKADARWRAARLVGNSTLAREDARQVWIARWVDELRQDVRYAVRRLRGAPGMTAAALAVLVAALGINTSLFTAFNAVLLRPWPVADASRVASVFAGRGRDAVTFGGWSAVETRHLRARSTTMDLVSMRDERVTFDFQAVGTDTPVRIASDNYFSVLGLPIQHGRGFERGDDELDAARAVVVLSDDVWRTGYGARPDILGQTVMINNLPFMVIGIAGAGALDNPLDPAPGAWLPFASLTLLGGGTSQRDALTSPAACCQDLAGRLKRGVSLATAEAELTVLSQQFRSAKAVPFVGVRVTGTALLDTPRAGTATPIFAVLFAGVLLLLVLACANVGNILLARSMARAPEMRVRLALGASRARVVRQSLTESLVLSGIAAALALPLAYWLPSRILEQVSPRLALSLNTRPDAMVLIFVLFVTTLTSLLFGLAPALRVTGAAMRLAANTRTGADRGTARLRLALLASQITISGMLLVGSVLLSRAVSHASAIPLGFAASEVSVAKVWLPANAYSAERSTTLTDALLASTETVDASAAATNLAPLDAGRLSRTVRRPDEMATANRTAEWQEVSPRFFEVLGIPVVAGRQIAEPLGADEAVVNEALARALWRDADPIGQWFISSNGRAFAVAAVVRDARLAAIDEVLPTVFRVGAHDGPRDVPATALTLMLRGPAAEARLRSATAAVESRARVTVRPMQAYVDDQLRPSLVGATIAGALGLLAAIVSAVGVFGVFSFLVSSREREIGIRLALGAGAREIAGTILRAAALALIAGLSVGLVGALALVPLLGRYLHGMSPFDPLAFAASAAVLGVAALAATASPLRRALRVDPAVTLRSE